MTDRTYPIPPIPDGADLAGNYYAEAISLAHTGAELADFNAWMQGQTLCLDNQGRVVVFARDYERWIDLRRRPGYRTEADHPGGLT